MHAIASINFSRRAAINYRKYHGKEAGKMAQKVLPEMEIPEFSDGTDYARTGQTIVLYAGGEHFERFADDSGDLFFHHDKRPYLYLLGKQFWK